MEVFIPINRQTYTYKKERQSTCKGKHKIKSEKDTPQR